MIELSVGDNAIAAMFLAPLLFVIIIIIPSVLIFFLFRKIAKSHYESKFKEVVEDYGIFYQEEKFPPKQGLRLLRCQSDSSETYYLLSPEVKGILNYYQPVYRLSESELVKLFDVVKQELAYIKSDEDIKEFNKKQAIKNTFKVPLIPGVAKEYILVEGENPLRLYKVLYPDRRQYFLGFSSWGSFLYDEIPSRGGGRPVYHKSNVYKIDENGLQSLYDLLTAKVFSPKNDKD